MSEGERRAAAAPWVQRLFEALARRRAVTVVVALLVSGAVWSGAGRLVVDSDLLCALPPADPEVRLLRGLESRFGILSTALVGAYSDELFSAPALQALRNISRAVLKVPGVAHAQSITEVLDVESTQDGSTVAPLIKEIPTDPSALRALQARVLTRDGVAGNLVSLDGRAALVVIQLAPGADAPSAAAAIRDVALANAGPLRLNLTGAPIVADFVSREAGKRVAVFVPGALLAVIVVLLAFAGPRRRARQLWLPLASGGLAVAWTFGAVATSGVSLCAAHALGFALPFVLGLSAGAVVARRGLYIAGPVLFFGAFVTAAALSALAYFPETRFQALVGAMGALFAFLAATLLGSLARVDDALAREGDVAAPVGPRWRPVALGALLSIFALGGGVGLLRLQAPTSSAAAFGDEDAPRLAERFLGQHFAYGETIFVEVEGDLRNAAVVRGVESLEHALHAVPGVTTVQAITIPLRLTHESMTGRRQLPAESHGLTPLWAMLGGNKDIATLVSRDHQRAMLLVQLVPGQANEAATAVRGVVARYAAGEVRVISAQAPDFGARRTERVVEQLRALAARYGKTAPKELAARVTAATSALSAEVWRPVVGRAVVTYFESDEALVPLREEKEPKEVVAPRADKVTATLAPLVFSTASREARLASLLTTLREVIPASLVREDPEALTKAASFVLERARSSVLEALTAQLRTQLDPGARPAEPSRAVRYDAELKTALYGVLDEHVHVFVPGAEPKSNALHARATGPSLAVLSADRAQRRSTGWGGLTALALALLVMLAVRRSPWGAVAALPGSVAALTSVGALGIAGVPTDPMIVALVILALGAGLFAGVLALPGRAGPAPEGAAVPLLAAAALFASLLASDFVPLQRFGAAAALALVAAAAAAAWLSTRVRGENGRP